MSTNEEKKQIKTNIAGFGMFKNLTFFFFLVILPLSTLYLAFTTVQKNLEEDQEVRALDEMAEITAHMQRLSDPQSYFQERLHRLSESFRWTTETNDVLSPGYENAIELFLFDSEGKRVDWAAGERGKLRISENYLQLLIKASKEPGRLMNRREQSIAASFSGNSGTVYSLAKAKSTLVSFQSMGLRKFGAWFRPKLYGHKEGYLLAFIEPDKVSNYHLAERAIRKIQRLAGPAFKFAWLDLNKPTINSCTGNIKLKNEGRNLIGLSGLKSAFKHENTLFSFNDTPEGIRLVCFRQAPEPPQVLSTFQNLLYTIIPVLFLFLIWKTIFGIRLDLSVKLQFSFIFGYTALVGIVILLAGISAFQREKQASLISEQKHQAIKILEKIDRNFSSSYGDLLRQYRHFTHLLNQPDADPNEILKPLKKAQAEENLAFASYVDQKGNFLFRAPTLREDGNTSVPEVKYANLINSVSSQVIRTFNSSRQPNNQAQDVLGVAAISSKPVQGLLHNRSELQNITFDGDETITFIDLTINEADTASGCLFIVHDPKQLQIKYLSSSGRAIAETTGFQLAAFPKKTSEKTSYFPRYSLMSELPLWKLQDLVNQTQVASFKSGKIDGKDVLVAATPGHNLKNFNLFLIMPMEAIKKDSRNLTRSFWASTILAVIFIAFLSGMLIRSLITPITHLAVSAEALDRNVIETVPATESNELESISIGLADLIIKVREFKEGHTIKRHLLPPGAITNGSLACDGFQITRSHSEREIYHFANLNENQTLLFLMRTDLEGIEGSLHLSMARMAVRLISEELNVHSPYRILKDLEEYFRINLRRHLGGDFFLGIIDREQNKFCWSGCGEIAVYLLNSGSNEIEKPELPKTTLGSNLFHNFTFDERPFSDENIAIIASPVLASHCYERLLSFLPQLSKENLESMKQKLQKEAEKHCSGQVDDSASLLLAMNISEEKSDDDESA